MQPDPEAWPVLPSFEREEVCLGCWDYIKAHPGCSLSMATINHFEGGKRLICFGLCKHGETLT